jgi:hypothetical protein
MAWHDIRICARAEASSENMQCRPTPKRPHSKTRQSPWQTARKHEQTMKVLHPRNDIDFVLFFSPKNKKKRKDTIGGICPK